jgi:hypothetical protein
MRSNGLSTAAIRGSGIDSSSVMISASPIVAAR